MRKTHQEEKSDKRPNWLKFVSEAHYCKICGNILGFDPNKSCWLCERSKERMSEEFQKLDWNELSRLGFIKRINKEILHPLGYALYREVETGISPGALVSPDGKWLYPEDIEEGKENESSNR